MRCAWPQLVLAPIPYVRILTWGGNTLANLSAVKQLKKERELVQHQLFGLNAAPEAFERLSRKGRARSAATVAAICAQSAGFCADDCRRWPTDSVRLKVRGKQICSSSVANHRAVAVAQIGCSADQRFRGSGNRGASIYESIVLLY